MYIADINGKNVRKLTSDTLVNYKATWSPDGKRIAFGQRENGYYQIAIIDANGNKPLIITKGKFNNTNPSWSRDGKNIAFQSDRDGNLEIYKIEIESQIESRLTNNLVTDSNPAWSPDGKIAFQSKREGVFAIFTMDAYGTDIKRVTSLDQAHEEPEWSLDGTRIGMAITKNGKYEIGFMNVSDSKFINLSNFDGFDYMTSWLPDNKSIIFASNRSGQVRLHRVNVDNPDETPLLFP